MAQQVFIVEVHLRSKEETIWFSFEIGSIVRENLVFLKEGCILTLFAFYFIILLFEIERVTVLS